jgi:uncharacterized protein with NRDE domain
MCLILIAHQTHPLFKLILAANRDEYYDRPSAPPAFWEEAPSLLAGRDMIAGGTWLGITRNGRIGAITNYRDPSSFKKNAPSRGILVSRFLLGRENPLDYLEGIQRHAHEYNGFNLILGTREQLYWYSNRGSAIFTLLPGLYGLSNHLLDTPWPKVIRGKETMAKILARADGPFTEELFHLLSDRTLPDDERLPQTGVGTEWERILSPLFISSPTYGTRSSTLLFIDRNDRVTFLDRTFDAYPDQMRPAHFEFTLET